MRLSKQALNFLRYLYEEGALPGSDPFHFGSVRGFLFREGSWVWGAKGEKVIRVGSRKNSVERTVLNLYRNGYVKRRLLGGPALGFDYQLTEKGLQALTDRKYVEKT
jgi:hypothetical protein